MQHDARFAPVPEGMGLVFNIKHKRIADAIDTVNGLEPAEAAEVLSRLPLHRIVSIFDRPELRDATAIIGHMRPEVARNVLEGIGDDRAADILAELDEELRADLLSRLKAESRISIQQLLQYPPDTAAGLMTTEFVSVPSNRTVAEVLAHIRHVERSRETIYAIYVVEPDTEVLTAVVTLRRLITAEPGQAILAIAQDGYPVHVAPLADREEVARLIGRHDLLAIPVLDNDGRILGIVTVDDIIDAMTAATTEDVQKLGGMEALGRPYMQIGFLGMIRKRAGWLTALFLSEMLTASAMQHYENELQKAVVLTLFLPLIMSSGGNSGSQATSLLIRSLALGEVRLREWWRVLLRELPAGIALGSILGIVGIARVTLWQEAGIYDYGVHWPLIALTVGAALVGVVTFGSVAGSMLPFVLQRLGFDPASASAPFIATLVDVTGLVIYFSVALFILSGTLL